MQKYKFHANKVLLNEPMKSLKEAKSQRYYAYKYKTKPMWKSLSIAKRNKKYVLVGVKK